MRTNKLKVFGVEHFTVKFLELWSKRICFYELKEDCQMGYRTFFLKLKWFTIMIQYKIKRGKQCL